MIPLANILTAFAALSRSKDFYAKTINWIYIRNVF